MAALATRTCPECGYTATDEDVALHWQREFYLDATRWEVWLAPLVIVGIAIMD